jgi:hypothetical protein
MPSDRIILGLGLHRPEMIPVMSEWMGSFDTILLEEPASPEFDLMLAGGISIDDYLMQQDLEYPVFSGQLCRLLQKLSAQKKTIQQVEPYLETLADIHDLFADGYGPADIVKKSVQHQVYVAEHNATGALLDFYDVSVSGTFGEIIDAVKHFAKMDAARFRLRDTLRAKALISWMENHSSVFIEAGLIHFPLHRLLRQYLPAPTRLRTVFLADAPLKSKGIRGRLYGPGDQLTLLYVFHPRLKWPDREALLAARALVYNKLVDTHEHEDSGHLTHLLDEQACIHVVEDLSLDDCGRLFSLIQKFGCQEALSMVKDTGVSS